MPLQLKKRRVGIFFGEHKLPKPDKIVLFSNKTILVLVVAAPMINNHQHVCIKISTHIWCNNRATMKLQIHSINLVCIGDIAMFLFLYITCSLKHNVLCLVVYKCLRALWLHICLFFLYKYFWVFDKWKNWEITKKNIFEAYRLYPCQLRLEFLQYYIQKNLFDCLKEFDCLRSFPH